MCRAYLIVIKKGPALKPSQVARYELAPTRCAESGLILPYCYYTTQCRYYALLELPVGLTGASELATIDAELATVDAALTGDSTIGSGT